MIYSKKLKNYIPVTVEKTSFDTSGNNPQMTRYIVKDGRIPVGRVDLSDTKNGVFVNYIENYNQHAYGNFGQIADQIEVEHCLKRGLTDFEVNSKASLNSHAMHYLRGKRFLSDQVNESVKSIIEKTPKGEQFNTKFLGQVEMFMPKGLIQKYMEIIKKMPLLK